MHALFIVNLKGTDVMYLCRMLIYFLFHIIFGTLCRHRCYGAEVIYHFFYFFLFILSSGMEYRSLSQICGRLYFPLFLLRVQLLTLHPVSQQTS